MSALLIILTVADLALGVLLISVSGFILEGVNNTGPMMPDAIYFVAELIGCFLAPLVAWGLRRRIGSQVALIIAGIPLVVALIALNMKPS